MRLLRALVALMTTVALVVGVPILLLQVSDAPLTIVADLVEGGLDARLTDTMMVGLLALAVWVIWVAFCGALVTEVVTAIGRGPRPALRLGVIQSVARWAVVSVTVGVSVGSSLHQPAAARPLPLAARPVPSTPAVSRVHEPAPVQVVAPGTPVAAATPAPEAPPAAAPPGYATVIVRRGDSAWALAERHLGDGHRWREIYDASCTIAQPGGVVWERPEDLDVGWTVLIPTPTDSEDGGLFTPATSTWTVQRGEYLWKIVPNAYTLDDPDDIETVVGAVAEANALADPDLLHIDQVLALPVVGAAPTAAPSPAPPPATLEPPPADAAPADLPPPAEMEPVHQPPPLATITPVEPALTPVPPVPLAPPPTPDVASPPVEHSPPATSDGNPGIPWTRTIPVATLLATGALTLIDARRRRRLQRMGRSDLLPLADPDLAPVDAALRAGADRGGVARLDAALRHLAAELAGVSGAPPRPEVVVRHANGRIEVHLDRPTNEPPAPWLAAGPRTWALPSATATHDLALPGRRPAPPCPALVMLGRDGDSEVYLDLEAAGVVRLDGDDATALSLVRGLLAGLAVSPLADVVRVVAVGVDVYAFENEARVEVAESAAAASRAARLAAAPVQTALTDEGVATTFALRGVAHHEPWEPIVVLLLGAPLDGASAVKEVVELAGDGGRGIALVTDGQAVASRWSLSMLGDRRWRLEPLGLTITPVTLAADELADIGALLQDARSEPVTPSRTVNPVTTVEPDPFVEPPWAIQVRVLGPVDLVNTEGKTAVPEKSKSLELLVWLAQHRASSTRSAARTAMWETDVRDATFSNVVSDARRTLARLAAPPDGQDWIGRASSDRLPLHPLVVTDADLVRARLDHARMSADGDAIETLRDALEMVRDLPYAGTSYLWPDGEGLVSNLVLLATATAAEMATRCLRIGDVEGVFWATSQGLRVLPGHDELVCLRMQAHAAVGDLSGVRNEYEAYERVVLNDAWGDATPSPKVVDCRRHLLAAPFDSRRHILWLRSFRLVAGASLAGSERSSSSRVAAFHGRSG